MTNPYEATIKSKNIGSNILRISKKKKLYKEQKKKLSKKSFLHYIDKWSIKSSRTGTVAKSKDSAIFYNSSQGAIVLNHSYDKSKEKYLLSPSELSEKIPIELEIKLLKNEDKRISEEIFKNDNQALATQLYIARKKLAALEKKHVEAPILKEKEVIEKKLQASILLSKRRIEYLKKYEKGSKDKCKGCSDLIQSLEKHLACLGEETNINGIKDLIIKANTFLMPKLDQELKYYQALINERGLPQEFGQRLLENAVPFELAAKYKNKQAYDIANLVNFEISPEEANKYHSTFGANSIRVFVESGISAEKVNSYLGEDYIFGHRFGAEEISALAQLGISPKKALKALKDFPEHSGVQTQAIYMFLVHGLSREDYDRHKVDKAGQSRIFYEIVSEHISEQLSKKEKKTLEKEFGITEYHRYGVEILRDLIQNLDPKHKDDKDMALVIAGENAGQPFAYESYISFWKLNKKYKLMVVETDSQKELKQKVKKHGSMYGLDKDGKPNKQFQFTWLEGHGVPGLVTLGHNPQKENHMTFENVEFYDDALIDNTDKDLEELSPFIANKMVIASCKSGKKHDENGSSIGEKLFKWFRNLKELHAMKYSSNIHDIFLEDESGNDALRVVAADPMLKLLR